VIETNISTLVAKRMVDDDCVYAGLTGDGKQQIFDIPTDLSVAMTFNDGAKAVKNLNGNKTLRHDDWQIPNLGNLHLLQKRQNKGSLKVTFTTAYGSGSDCPYRY